MGHRAVSQKCSNTLLLGPSGTTATGTLAVWGASLALARHAGAGELGHQIPGAPSEGRAGLSPLEGVKLGEVTPHSPCPAGTTRSVHLHSQMLSSNRNVSVLSLAHNDSLLCVCPGRSRSSRGFRTSLGVPIVTARVS